MNDVSDNPGDEAAVAATQKQRPASETGDIIRISAVAGPLTIGLLISLYLVLGAGGLIGRGGSSVAALGNLALILIPIVLGGFAFLFKPQWLDTSKEWCLKMPVGAFAVAALLGFLLALTVRNVDYSRVPSDRLAASLAESLAETQLNVVSEIVASAFKEAMPEQTEAAVDTAEAGSGATDSPVADTESGPTTTDGTADDTEGRPATTAAVADNTEEPPDSTGVAADNTAGRPDAGKGPPDKEEMVQAISAAIMSRISNIETVRQAALEQLGNFGSAVAPDIIRTSQRSASEPERKRQPIWPSLPKISYNMGASILVGLCLAILLFVPDSVRRLMHPAGTPGVEPAQEEPPLSVYFGFVFGILIYLVAVYIGDAGI